MNNKIARKSHKLFANRENPQNIRRLPKDRDLVNGELLFT